MTISSGTRLGPYEILSAIGAGGMGEVYRARDTRLGRDVAIKVLPASFSADADRLRRFEQEARAAGILNHPNITAVFDIGESGDGSPYVVQELLEGETLRHELSGGKLSARRAIEHAIQIAHGLAAAHEKGIVHRDLKPENVFVTRDGRLKILDFGLARMTQAEDASPATDLPTATPGTEPGMVLGTLGYMSPEQVRGRPADARSDIFSFGAILYEMLAGQRAFKGDSAADTMSAILREDPPELSLSNENVSPGLERIVRHCIEKSPEQRFQSARDLAFDLEALSSDSAVRRPAAAPPSIGRSWRAPAAVAAAALLLMVPLAFWIGRRSNSAPIPAFRQLTFRRGSIRGARFTPDGQTVVFAAAWEGKPLAMYSMRTDSADAAPVDLPGGADLLAVGRSGEAALQLGRRSTEPYVTTGTLATAPIGGGQAPRERLQAVQWADWSPDGERLAIVRDAGGRNRLESPVGTVLYETAGWIGNPRFSPQGDAIALIDHWGRLGDLGLVVVVDLAGHARKLSEGWSSIQGLAWARDGKEVWFTGTRNGGNRALYAVGRSGGLRLVHRQTGSLTIADVSSKGEVLLVDEELRLGIMSRGPGDAAERDFSFMDFTALRALSSDGKLLLFDEASEGGGEDGSIFLRKTDGSPPVRLGPGYSMAFSRDAKWVLAGLGREPNSLRQLPVGAGEAREIAREKFAVAWGDWLSDGRVLVFGGETGRGARLWVQDTQGGEAKPITPEGVHLVPYTNLVSPDGRYIAAAGADGVVLLFPVSGGEPKPIRGLLPGEVPCSWDATGKFLFVYRPGEFPAHVFRVEIDTGARSPWKELMPTDPTGVTFIRPPHFSGDGGAYAYSFARALHTLFLARDLR